MNASAPRLASRVAVAVLLVLVAGGTVLAAAVTRPVAPAPAVAEPAASASPSVATSPEPEKSPRPEKSPKPETSPEAGAAEKAEESPSPANLARIVERLAGAGITTTADDLAALAAKVGVGGAIRVLRFAEASGKTSAAIVDMVEAGKGWGDIARELKLDIGPGNGSVMGQGKGLDSAAKAAAKAARAEAKAVRAAERAQQKAGADD